MKKLFFVFVFFSISLLVFAQEVNIVPKPVSLKVNDGTFAITPETKIVFTQNELSKSADFLNSYLQKFYGFKLNSAKTATSSNVILLSNNNKKKKIAGAYHLNVTGKQVNITGDDAQGVFYGIQSLIQLLPTTKAETLQIQQVSIVDSPRFAYRGLHLDVGRHFFPVYFIKEYIDFIALHKMNTFHWHLTEDQGWRIEIKKYPRLTDRGACRNGTITGHFPGNGNDGTEYCGFYTQDQVKEIVKYAADRYITVIPEIEMPGHGSAAIAAYPQLSCFPEQPTEIKHPENWFGLDTGKQVQQTWGVFPDIYCPSEYTFKFIENVLDEVIALFPSHYIHIGGDEAPKDYWKKSELAQKIIKQNGLKDEHELQSYFIRRIEKYLNSKGRDIIGWDEILEGGLAPNATVMSWRGEKGGIEAAKQHHNVIMTPTTYVYFDYSQQKKSDSLTIGGFLPLTKVYGYDPVPAELAPGEYHYILGAQANLWTEYIKNTRKVEWMLFPRLSALSEVLWTPKSEKNWDDFKNRMQTQMQRYDLWQVDYLKDAYSEQE